jgi:hypothetical protein
MRTIVSLALVVVVVALATACGGGSSGNPVTPTPQPTVVNVAGLWTGSSTLTNVTGGECTGATYVGLVGTISPGTMQVTQTGNAVTAVYTSTSTGIYTDYSGTAGSSSVSLNWTYSSAGILTGFHCMNGQVRDLKLVTDTITANVSGNSVSGTAAETWDVYVTGTQTSVGVLLLNTTFTMTR